MFDATFNLVTRVDYRNFWNQWKDGSLEINSLALNNCFSYRNIIQNGVNALSKMFLETRFFVKKLKISYSLDHTILFKISLACSKKHF